MGPIRKRYKDEKYLRRRADRVIGHVANRVDAALRWDYVHYSRANEGERFLIGGVKGLRAYWVAPGEAVNRMKIRTEELEPVTDHLAFVVEEERAKLRSKRFWADCEDLAIRALLDGVRQRVGLLREAAVDNALWLLNAPDPLPRVAVWPINAWAEFDRRGERFEIGAILPVAAACVPPNQIPEQ